MTTIYNLSIGFTLVFTIIGLIACALYFDRALDSLVSSFKGQAQMKAKQKQNAEKWLAAISFISSIRLSYQLKRVGKVVFIRLPFLLKRIVQIVFGLVPKIISLRANAKRNLEARIQNQHALQHAYSKF